MALRTTKVGSFTWTTLANDRYIGASLATYGEWSFGEIALLRALIDDEATVIEVGANIGAHTVPLARQAARGRVISFEPQRLCFQLLCANVINNRCENVDTRRAAVGADEGVVGIPDIRTSATFNYGGVSAIGDPGDGQEVDRVRQVSLDDDCADCARLDLIKCDAEGMELDVLRGAEALVARFKPLIYVEDDRLEKSAALLSWLSGQGYRVWWHAVPLFRNNNAAGETENIFPRVYSFSMLGVPKGREFEPAKDLIELRDMSDHPRMKTQSA